MTTMTIEQTKEQGYTHDKVVVFSKDMTEALYVPKDEVDDFSERYKDYIADMTTEEWEEWINLPAWIETQAEAALGGDNPEDDRPELIVANASKAAAELRELIGTGPLAGVFRRGHELVRTPRVGEDGYVEADNGDDDGPAQVQTITPSVLKTMVEVHYHVLDLVLDREATKEKGEKTYRQVEALVPRESIEHVYNAARSGDGTPHVRVLKGVTHTPVLRRDGSVLTEPGYDPVSKLLYLPDPGLEVPEVPDEPTDEDVAQAVKEILFVIKDFPFVSEDHRANWIGLAFTPMLKPLVPPPYQFGFITAPNPGSGKGFLADIIAGLHGRVMRGEMPRDAEELRKSITSTLLSTTAPVVQFDNLRGTIKSSVLEGLLTTSDWTDRHLGHNEDISVKNDRLWLATGNNAHLGGDMARRVIVVEIDPKMPNPETRKFDINPPRYVAEHRGKLLAAMLTIARGWYLAGMLSEPDRSDSFEVWRGSMRGLIKWAGMPGTFGGENNEIAVISEDDDEWGEFLSALHDVFEDRHFTASDVYDMLQPGSWEELPKVQKLANEVDVFDNLDQAKDLVRKAVGQPRSSALDPVKLPEQLSEKFAKSNAVDRSAQSFKKSLGRWMGYRVGRYA
jgi:hypothetical protein